MPKSTTKRFDASGSEAESRWRAGNTRRLLDEEIWAFIDAHQCLVPAGDDRPARSRNSARSMMRCAWRSVPAIPPASRALDGMIEAAGRSLPMRHYVKDGRAPQAIIVYYHGGGFVLGGLESHDDVCAELCAGTGYDVVSVDYRLAPEHVHPAAFDDACATFDWAADSARSADRAVRRKRGRKSRGGGGACKARPSPPRRPGPDLSRSRRRHDRAAPIASMRTRRC